jgi:hypothetical protein
MKKILTILVLMLLVISTSLVLAEGNMSEDAGNDDMNTNNTENEPIQNQKIEQVQEQVRTQIQEMVQNMNQTRMTLSKNMAGIFIENGNHRVRSKFSSLEEVEGKVNEFKAKLSNGKDAFVKIMPETASEKAIQALRLNNCKEENNCTIELKEVGQGNQIRAAYEIKTQKEGKLFGLFKKNMNVKAQIDAETGELIDKQKPWWAFMASESNQQSENSEMNAVLSCPDANGYYDEECPEVKQAIAELA